MSDLHIQHMTSDIDSRKLEAEISELIQEHALHNLTQVSLTSIAGEDNFRASIGRKHQLSHPEEDYKVPLKCLSGTYTESIIERFPEYYRWRVLILKPRTTYSIHHDALPDADNYRLHIPIKTNHLAYLMFFEPHFYRNNEKMLYNRDTTTVHLPLSNAYEVNVSGLHSAVNFGWENRIHLVGVRYQ